MAAGEKRSPTILGRWWEGKYQAVGIAAAWYMALLFVWLLVLWITSALSIPLLTGGPTLRDIFNLEPGNAWGDVTPLLLLVVAVVLVVFSMWVGSDHYRKATVDFTAPLRRHNRMAAMGKGGSAGFAGLVDEWEESYQPGAVLFGRSLYDGRVIAMRDDRGLLTIASNRSGKGRGAIIPNLLTWPGSAVVIDPKGTNAAVTAARRGSGGGRVTNYLGHAVHVLDPFGIVPGVRSARFNPLSSVDILGTRAREDIGLVVDALVVPSGPGDSHWDEGARQIIGGVIAHLMSKIKVGGYTSLLDVRKALLQDADAIADLFTDMMTNPVAGGMAQAAGAFVLNAAPNERGSLLTTVLRNTAWLDSVGMAGVLADSDFSMQDVKAKPTTVYVVLPPDLLEEHARFMRLFVNLTVRAAATGGKSRVPVLLVMDEFYSLGPLSSLAKASGALAGYGLKLWPIVQNLSQLRELYPKNWQTFFANAGAVQIFGVNDRETAQEITATLGKAVYIDQVDDRAVRAVANLLEGPEIEQITERGGGLQLVMRSGKPPMLLRKMLYDQDPLFNRQQYNADPDHPGS